MKVLLRTEYGSHLYGLSRPESDRDYKTVFLPTRADLLLGKPLKRKVVQTNPNEKNTAADVDDELIPVHCFVRDFVAGKMECMEIAFSPEAMRTLGTADETFLMLLKRLRRDCLTSNVKVRSVEKALKRIKADLAVPELAARGRKEMMHTLRCHMQALSLLEEGALFLPFSDHYREFLLGVRSGDVSFADAESVLWQLDQEVNEAYAHTTLPTTKEVAGRAEGLLLDFVEMSL